MQQNNWLSELLKNNGVKSDSRILKFEASKTIAVKILNDFRQFYDKEKGSFPLSEINGKSDGRFGIITDVMALSTYLELQSLDASIAGEDVKIFYGLISRIFASVYCGAQPVFDATPYADKAVISTYVETAAKIIPTMVDLRDDLLAKFAKSSEYSLVYDVEYPVSLLTKVNKKEYVEPLKSKDARLLLLCTEQLIVDSIEMLNESALLNNNGTQQYTIDGKVVARRGIFDNKILYRGWSFKKALENRDAEYDTSLFYTYLATNAFISLYNSMERFYDSMDNEVDPYDGLNPNYFTPKEKAIYDKFVADKHFYESNSSVLVKFRFATACAGRYIDSILNTKGVNISFTYVDKDLNAVTMADILSGNNNHIMNSLFVYAILINAGVDDDYNAVGKSSMYQIIQFALNNKIYIEFKDKEREDLIDSYSMGDERCPNEERKILQTWRKMGIPSPYNLVPLYFNTYYLMSEYVIKYPQKEMRENLMWVMENRDENRWFWTKNGFNLNNNLYYILALDLFYIYYKEYEQPIIEKYNARAEIEKHNAEITQLNAKYGEILSEKERQYAEKIEKVKGTFSPLDEELKNFIQKIIEQKWQDQFNKSMSAFVDEALEHCLSIAIASYEKKDELYAKLKNDNRFTTALLFAALEKSPLAVKKNESIKFESDETQMKQFKNKILDELFHSMFSDE